MRVLQALGVLAAIIAAASAPTAWAAEDAFDACTVFTQPDAESAMGTAAAPEPVNPKVKRPKVVPNCSYTGFKEGKAIAATVQFKFGRNDAEAQKAFDDARLQFQTKPMYISGADAFWSAKTGQMNLRKGRTWVQLWVGGPKPGEHDYDQSRKLAEIMVKKL